MLTHCCICIKPLNLSTGVKNNQGEVVFCSQVCVDKWYKECMDSLLVRDKKEKGKEMPYKSEQEMMKDFLQKMTPKKYSVVDTRKINLSSFGMLNDPFEAISKKAPLHEADQTPRQWNLITIKRCIVTREEFHYYGGLSQVLAIKGFPTSSPENGDLMISWFDSKNGVAYYELCRVQDQKELLKYMQESFVQQSEEEGGRAISLE